MEKHIDLSDPKSVAAKIVEEMRALPARDAKSIRVVRRKYSKKLNQVGPEFFLDIARELLKEHRQRWLACELIQNNKVAFQSIGEAELEEFGQGIDSWGSVDAFARCLSGPVWLGGQVSDELIHKWACSKDRWWRRAALVSTVTLNSKVNGGSGDTERTLSICRILIDDRDDMVYKALSWALRALVSFDPAAVQEFLDVYSDRLAARVKREVKNKLTTGLKNPKLKRG